MRLGELCMYDDDDVDLAFNIANPGQYVKTALACDVHGNTIYGLLVKVSYMGP